MPKNTMPMIRIHNLETDEIIDREMTESEYEKYLADKAQAEEKALLEAQKEQEKQALLSQIGLTAEQLELLLGS
jgi:hypothetical protein